MKSFPITLNSTLYQQGINMGEKYYSRFGKIVQLHFSITNMVFSPNIQTIIGTSTIKPINTLVEIPQEQFDDEHGAYLRSWINSNGEIITWSSIQTLRGDLRYNMTFITND